eukprot:g1314.t1
MGHSASCISCPVGKHQPKNGSSSCIDCIPGFRQPSPGQPRCDPCSTGKYTNTSGATSCLDCDAGRHQSDSGSSFCLDCTPGRYQEERGRQSCDKCSPETFSDEPGLKVCKTCDKGSVPDEKSIACQKCDLGKFGTSTGSCEKCEPGMYQDDKGKLDCKLCSNSEIPNEDQTACEAPPWKIPLDCKPQIEYLHNNLSMNRSDWDCEICPKGAQCAKCSPECSLDTLEPLPGWWRIPHRFYPPKNAPFAKCPFPRDCNEAEFANNSAFGCKEGTTGILCSRCEVGYDRTAGSCNVCVQGEIWIRIAGLVGLGVVMMMFLWKTRHRLRRIHRLYFHASKDARVVLKVLVSFVQVNLSMPVIISNFVFPEAYTRFINVFSPLNIDLASILGMQCVVDMDVRYSLLLTAMMPLIVVSFTFAAMRRGKQKMAKKDQRVQRVTSTKLESNMHTMNNEQRKALGLEVFDLTDIDGSGDLDSSEILYLMNEIRSRSRHPSRYTPEDAKKLMMQAGSLLTNLSLSRDQFVKTPLPNQFHFHVGLTRYLTPPLSDSMSYSYSVRCYSSEWNSFLVIAVGLMIFFAFGFPIYLALDVFLNRHHLQAPSTRLHLGWLYSRNKLGVECSYFLTTLKYLISLVYTPDLPENGSNRTHLVNQDSNRLSRDKDDMTLTVILITFDVAVIILGLVSTVIMFMLLPKERNKSTRVRVKLTPGRTDGNPDKMKDIHETEAKISKWLVARKKSMGISHPLKVNRARDGSASRDTKLRFHTSRQNRKRPHIRTMGGEAKMDAIDNKTVDHVGTITSDIQSSILELVNSATRVYMDQVAQLQKEKGQQAAAIAARDAQIARLTKDQSPSTVDRLVKKGYAQALRHGVNLAVHMNKAERNVANHKKSVEKLRGRTAMKQKASLARTRSRLNSRKSIKARDKSVEEFNF